MFENFSTRDCNKCIHHISGNCTKWDCEMETLEQFKQRVQAETIDKIICTLEGIKDRAVTTDTFGALEEAIEMARQLKEKADE